MKLVEKNLTLITIIVFCNIESLLMCPFYQIALFYLIITLIILKDSLFVKNIANLKPYAILLTSRPLLANSIHKYKRHLTKKFVWINN